MNAKLEELLADAERLVVIVVGPGFGESIGIRVPPDRWMLVDSLAARPAQHRPPVEGLTPLAGLLERLDATAEIHKVVCGDASLTVTA